MKLMENATVTVFFSHPILHVLDVSINCEILAGGFHTFALASFLETNPISEVLVVLLFSFLTENLLKFFVCENDISTKEVSFILD